MRFVGGCTVVSEVVGASVEYVVPPIFRPQAQGPLVKSLYSSTFLEEPRTHNLEIVQLYSSIICPLI